MIQQKKSPVTWVPSLYFAMGLPFVVLNMVSALMFRGMGVDDTSIAFWTSLIMLPWTLKPLWSPLLEIFKTKKYFVILTQIASGVLFAMIAISLQMTDFFVYSIALMALIALSGATHDIAADGVYMSSLDKKGQAQYIGWQGAFYNISKIVATGGLVALAGELTESQGVVMSWVIVMGICSAILFLLGLYHIKMLPSTPRTVVADSSFKGTMVATFQTIKALFLKKHIWYYMVFIVLYRFAEGFVMKIVPLFLASPIEDQGLGLTVKEIGLYYGTFGAAAFVGGAILGGYYISNKGLSKVLFKLCVIFNIPFVVYALLAFFQPENMWVIGSAIVFEYFGYGFGFVGLTLFMMQQIAPGKHQMAHYAFATGIMNLGVMLPGMLSGFLSDMFGYQDFFMWVMIATIPSMLITYFVPFTYKDNEK